MLGLAGHARSNFIAFLAAVNDYVVRNNLEAVRRGQPRPF